VDLLEQSSLVEGLEVPADGHVRHAELADQVRDADRPVLSDTVQDDRLALACKHQCAVPGPSRRLTIDTASR
jgi:hypothetical protein